MFVFISSIIQLGFDNFQIHFYSFKVIFISFQFLIGINISTQFASLTNSSLVIQVILIFLKTIRLNH